MFNSKKTREVAEKIVNSTNIISRGTRIQGDIEAEGSFRIEGTLIGNLKTQSKLVLAPGGHLKGNILAKNVEIGGTLEGKIEATETLILRTQAKVKGDLHVHQLIVDVGAQFNGQCHMHLQEDKATIAPKKESDTVLEAALKEPATVPL